MKLFRLTTVALTLLLAAGCASTSKSTSTPTPENPIENPDKDFPIEGNPAPTNPIEDDGTAKITIEDNVIYVDGVKSGVIDETEGQHKAPVYGPDGKQIGTVNKLGDGTYTYHPYPEGGREWVFTVDNGVVNIDWARSSLDPIWGVTPPKEPRVDRAKMKSKAADIKTNIQKK